MIRFDMVLHLLEQECQVFIKKKTLVLVLLLLLLAPTSTTSITLYSSRSSSHICGICWQTVRHN